MSEGGFEVKVGGRYFGGDRGYIILVVNGKEYFLDVEVKGRKILLSLGERRGIPLSKAELLFTQPPFEELGRRERSKLREIVLAEVYALINRGEGVRSLLSFKVGSYTVKLYEDGTVGAYGPNLKKRVSLKDLPELKAQLLAALEAEGVGDALGRLAEVFEEMERQMRGRAVIEMEGAKIYFADGVRLRRMLANGGLHVKLWVYGRVEKGDTALLGCYPVYLVSRDGKVEASAKNPFAEEETVLTYPLQLVRNAVLTTDETADLLEEIKRANEGGKVPEWREVFEEIRELSRKFIGIEEEYRTLIALFIIYCYFYDLLPRATYIAFVGESGSGKNNARSFVDALTPSVTVMGPTEAAMARLINSMAPVLSLDETQLDEEWIRHILNAGTQKGLYVIRCHKDDPDRIIALDPFGPKVLVAQPPDIAKLFHDTRNRTIIVPMQRRKGYFEREVTREVAWPIVKKLILLSLYRWREFIEAWKHADRVLSLHFSGHARETWLPLFSVALLVGREALETVATLACRAYRERGDLDAFTAKVVYGCLRVLSLHAEEEVGGLRESERFFDEVLAETSVERVDGRWILKLSAKHIAILNGEDPSDRSYVTKVGLLLHRGALPFVVDRSREGKKGRMTFYIDVEKLRDYVESYELEIPEDVNVEKIEEKYGVKFTAAAPLAKQLVESLIGTSTQEGRESLPGAKVSKVSEVSASASLTKNARELTEEKQTSATKVYENKIKGKGVSEENYDVKKENKKVRSETSETFETSPRKGDLYLASGSADLLEVIRGFTVGGVPSSVFERTVEQLAIIHGEGVRRLVEQLFERGLLRRVAKDGTQVVIWGG